MHPGVAHYLIHHYDYPPIADKGLTAARRYATIAPAVPHALHMPSHIFTRRGHWRESIDSNVLSARSAANHFDQLHAMDYPVYAHQQQAQDDAAARVLAQMNELRKTTPEPFVTGYALTAIPSRYALERGRWTDAGALTLFGNEFPWARFPQSEAVLVFARGLGRRGPATSPRAGGADRSILGGLRRGGGWRRKSAERILGVIGVLVAQRPTRDSSFEPSPDGRQ